MVLARMNLSGGAIRTLRGGPRLSNNESAVGGHTFEYARLFGIAWWVGWFVRPRTR